MMDREIIVVDDIEGLAVRAAEEIAHVAGDAICTHGEFTFCLTGGETPAPIYELLATRFHHSIDWSEVQFFWGDERCVPPDDSASNFGLAHRTMLSKLDLRPEQVHRMRGEDPPDQAAAAYERDLQNFFKITAGELPSFNLVMLGLGDNAHIASLFPHTPSIHVKDRLAIAVEVDAPQRHRISLTAPVINQAAYVLFVVSGASKAEAVKHVLDDPPDPDSFPAQLVMPDRGHVLWLVDKDAARLLA